jgi:L-ribulose-5-phosphate 3-epimerase
LNLAKELETIVVTTHIGIIPEEPGNPRWGIHHEACVMLGEYGENVGACFVIESGLELAVTLAAFLESIHSKGAGVNFTRPFLSW